MVFIPSAAPSLYKHHGTNITRPKGALGGAGKGGAAGPQKALSRLIEAVASVASSVGFYSHGVVDKNSSGVEGFAAGGVEFAIVEDDEIGIDHPAAVALTGIVGDGGNPAGEGENVGDLTDGHGDTPRQGGEMRG